MSDDILVSRRVPKKTGLGRGLGSLLGPSMPEGAQDFTDSSAEKSAGKSASAAATKATTPVAAQTVTAQKAAAPEIPETARIWNIAIEKLIPNKEQPRKHFSKDELKDLADSIRAKGIIQPILARKIEAGNYQIIAGERRWRAAQQAGLKDVPVILKQTNPQEVLEIALIENIQRHDLNPIEEAEAYAVLTQKYKLTQQEISEKVGKERATVANVMRLLGLHRDVRELVKAGEIQLGQAKVLLSVADQDVQRRLAKKAAQQKLTVRALERLVIKALDKSDGVVEELEEDDADIYQRLLKDLANDLQKSLGTKVHIEFSGRKGRISIDFYSVDELNGIADRIKK